MNDQEKTPPETADPNTTETTEPKADDVQEKDLNEAVGGLRYHTDLTTNLPIKEA